MPTNYDKEFKQNVINLYNQRYRLSLRKEAGYTPP